MALSTTFDELLDAVATLPPDEQADLVSVIGRRPDEQRRAEIVAEVRDGRAAFASGEAVETTVEDLMREIGS